MISCRFCIQRALEAGLYRMDKKKKTNPKKMAFCERKKTC